MLIYQILTIITMRMIQQSIQSFHGKHLEILDLDGLYHSLQIMLISYTGDKELTSLEFH